MLLYIARHGQSMGNTGTDDTLDPVLTDIGLRQADLLGEYLSDTKFDAIFASTLVRSIQTAAGVASRQPGGPAPLEVLADLVECGTTPGWKGRTKDDLLKFYPDLVLTKDSIPPDYPAWEDESIEIEHLARAYRVISYIKQRFDPYSDKKILLVAHGGFNQKLLAAAMGWGNASGVIYSQSNTCLNLIEYFREKDGSPRVRLKYTNAVTHLWDKDCPIT
ncbi:MAG: histidine phosphatase family protein [Clostridia bacterium]|nr:histidine phosphatase family protein [Clostridia bacterium]